MRYVSGCLSFLLLAVSFAWSHSGPDGILNSLHKEKKVILVLVDGVRYDYVKDPSLKGFQRMARKGVKAEYVQPIFPSNSYPNWYTIVTGMPSASLFVQLCSSCPRSLSLFAGAFGKQHLPQDHL